MLSVVDRRGKLHEGFRRGLTGIWLARLPPGFRWCRFGYCPRGSSMFSGGGSNSSKSMPPSASSVGVLGSGRSSSGRSSSTIAAATQLRTIVGLRLLDDRIPRRWLSLDLNRLCTTHAAELFRVLDDVVFQLVDVVFLSAQLAFEDFNLVVPGSAAAGQHYHHYGKCPERAQPGATSCRIQRGKHSGLLIS